MGIEYRIKFEVPKNYSPQGLFKKLPSPIYRETMREIYSYSIAEDGFFFLDSLVDRVIASVAFRLFVDEALRYSQAVVIVESENLWASVRHGRGLWHVQRSIARSGVSCWLERIE